MKSPYRLVLGIVGMTLALLGTARVLAGGGNPYIPRTVPPPPGYAPGYAGGFYPGAVGGALMGQASVINATGELKIQTEQAYQEREKANQAKIDTKKKSFDQMMYEKANTATYTENVQYEQSLTLQRMMSSPQPHEITSGKTLNAMLPQIFALSSKGTQGPPISINQDQLKHINVTVGKGGENLGMLRDGGARLDWPLVLQGPKQQKVAGQIPIAVSQVQTGMLDAKLYREINSQIAEINEDLRKKFHKEEIDGGEFLEGKRFLEPLQQSMQALRQPTSQRFLDGTYTAKGRTVPELAYHMTSNGLSFASCNPGNEAVYFALHDMFVAYTTSAQAAGGVQVRYTPPRTAPWQVK